MTLSFEADVVIWSRQGDVVNSFGEGIARNVITALSTHRLSGPNSTLQEGHGEQLYWQPRVLSNLIEASEEQKEDAFVDGAVIALQLMHCHTYPRGMSLPSILVHLAGSTKSFTRQAASAWLPDFEQAVDQHRVGNIQSFAQFAYIYLSIPVSQTPCHCYLLQFLLIH